MLGRMTLPDRVIEAAKLAYQEGKFSEDRLDDLVCHRRLKRFARFKRSKFRRLSNEDMVVLAEHVAFSSIRPSDPELCVLAQQQVEAWNADPEYRGSFGLSGAPVDTAHIVQHYLGSIGVGEGPRHRTRQLRLSTVGLDDAARILKPCLPKEMAWTVTGGGYTADENQTGARTPSKAEVWLLEQMYLIEPFLLGNLLSAQGVVREIINRTP